MILMMKISVKIVLKQVYLPNSKSNPIKRIETLVHVSVAGQELQSIVLMTLITPNKRLRMD
jgi:hypothetical protein